MVVKVGINGFGRIGRILFRTCFDNSNIEVSAINDPAIDVEYICYLIKFDSTHGKFNATIESYKDDIKINGNLIKIFHEKQPAAIPWQSADVQYVIESSGMFTSLEKALGHLSGGGVKRVVVTAPSIDVPMIILGVNDDKLHPDLKVISCASSTLYCLAPIMKVLENDFGVAEGFVTSIHAMTPSLKPLDGLCLKGKHWRDHRSIHQNIIPATTGACKVLGKILPQSKDKMVGLAFRVPIVNVSVLDLTIRLNKDTKLENIVRSVENASKTYLKGIINISNEEAVSSDFNRDTHSCILDVNSSMQHKPNFIKLVCWYENEFSYACRVIDSIFFSERQYNQNIKETNLNSLVIKKKNLTRESLEYLRQPHVIGDNCTTDTLPNILRDVSKSIDFKMKPQYSQIFRKRPLSSQISVINQSTLTDWKTRNRSDIFKTIDYDEITDKPASKHNKKSFYKSCISLKLPSPDRNDTKMVRNGLENVKREFNKIVNITEELLKKSKEHQFNRLKTISSESKIEYNLNKLQKEPDLIQRNLNDDKISIKNATKMQTDNLFEYKYLNNENKNEVTLNSEAISLKRVDKTLTIDKTIDTIECMEGEDGVGFQEENNIHVKTLYDFCETVTKSCTSSEIISERAINELQEYKTKNNIQKNSFHQITTSPINVMSHECHLSTKNESEKQIREQYLDYENLKVRNTITSGDGITTVLENKNTAHVIETVILRQTEDNKREQNENKALRRIVAEQNDLVLKQVKSRNILLRPSQETTNISINKMMTDVNEMKDDIYDKLDSTSATNSDNSFHMDEKQSQVININDLTNSLDDLSRLEKICRIIEISDDLSNQLFSTLQENDTTNMKNKKWSFKDLCEKIQLDDFCNKVFSQTNK